jgi:hypothetical protein
MALSYLAHQGSAFKTHILHAKQRNPIKAARLKRTFLHA